MTGCDVERCSVERGTGKSGAMRCSVLFCSIEGVAGDERGGAGRDGTVYRRCEANASMGDVLITCLDREDSTTGVVGEASSLC